MYQAKIICLLYLTLDNQSPGSFNSLMFLGRDFMTFTQSEQTDKYENNYNNKTQSSVSNGLCAVYCEESVQISI